MDAKELARRIREHGRTRHKANQEPSPLPTPKAKRVINRTYPFGVSLAENRPKWVETPDDATSLSAVNSLFIGLHMLERSCITRKIH